MRINVLVALMTIVSFLIAIVLHELSHIAAARLLGDDSAVSEGRQTFNLRAHIDPLGLLLCIVLAFQPVASGQVGLGWGKPFKPDTWKMRTGPNIGMFIVAWAGLLSTLCIGIIATLVVRFLPLQLASNNLLIFHLYQFVVVFGSVNICLAIFNLFPLYPLDGYTIIFALLPERQAKQFARSEPYGPTIILALFFLLPFIGQLAGGSTLFDIPRYILIGALSLMSLITGYDFSVFYLY